MNIIIQSLGFTAGKSLESFTREKISKLKSDRIIKATVTLYKGPETEPGASYCEIRLDMPGNDPFVKRHDSEFETAINQCVEVLQEMLRQEKERHIRSRQASAQEIQDVINQAEADQDPDLEDVVK